MIDHTILKADATEEDVLRIIEEAKPITSILSASIQRGFH